MEKEPLSFLSFIRLQSTFTISSFVAEYLQDSETKHRTHALVRAIIGISSFWAAPLAGVLGAMLAFLLPAFAMRTQAAVDGALNKFWFDLPALFKLIVPVIAIISVVSMIHVITIPVLSHISMFVAMLFSIKLGNGLYLANWAKETDQAAVNKVLGQIQRKNF